MLIKTVINKLLFIGFLSFGPAAFGACGPGGGLALQVLGSGGPIADDGRASSGYLLWIDGRARLLVDAGGGVFLRFGEAGARFADLDAMALSHLHTDHSADLPALLKSGYFAGSARRLVLSGPGGAGRFPGVRSFVDSLIGHGGAYGYLHGYLSGSGRLRPLAVIELDVDDGPVTMDVGEHDRFVLEAIPVPHGIVPAIAYKATVRGQSIVFGGDQTARDQRFADFAKGADLLIMHLPIPERADRIARQLHGTPSDVGRAAAAIAPGRLLLSHFMARSLGGLDEGVARIEAVFDGPVLLAEDLMCLPLEVPEPS